MVLWFNTWINTWANALNSTGISNKTYRVNVNTYNPRYPWFDEEDYKKLERLASSKWVTGSAKTNLMDELYQYYYPQVSNSHKLDERQVELNQAAYQNDGKEPWNTNIKLTSISQQAKQKYWISATVPDDQLLDSIVKWTPNWQKLLEDYINNGNPEFLYVAWIQDRPKEEVKKESLWEAIVNNFKEWLETPINIVGWAYDSVTWAWRFLAKWTADVIGWTAKQLWADEDKVNSLVQSYKDSLKDFSWEAIGADTDSVSYNVTKWVWDIAQVMAWEALLKWAVQWTAKWAELLNYMKNAPTWQKMIAWWLEWAWDMTLYSIVADGELPSVWEAWVGAAIWAAIPGAAAWYKAAKPYIQKWTQKIANKLQLSWLLNPAKLNAVKNQLIDEWTDLAKAWLKSWEADDVWKWMIERWFKGDKPTIIKDLWEHATKSHALKKEILWASNSLHNVESAKKSLQVIKDQIEWVPGLEKRLARVEELMWKSQHTLSELDEIKSILDDTVSIYKTDWAVGGGMMKKGLDNVRKDLRKYIEDAATKEWLGNIKLLNNETQIAKALEDAISRKDSADAAREILSIFDKGTIWGWLLWGVAWWPFDNDTFAWKMGNIIVGSLAWKYLFSTKSKTNIAAALNKMSWWSKKELSRLIWWEIATKDLSKATMKWLEKVFKNAWLTQVPSAQELTAEEISALANKYTYSDLPKVIWAAITTSVTEDEE